MLVPSITCSWMDTLPNFVLFHISLPGKQLSQPSTYITIAGTFPTSLTSLLTSSTATTPKYNFYGSKR